MKYKYPYLLVAFVLCFVTNSFSQISSYAIRNSFTAFGGITKFDITTDNFVTSQGNGFLGGLSATVDLPHRWYNMSFGMQLSENNIGVSARPTMISMSEEFVDYKIFAAQVALMGHIKLIGTYLMIDIGPMVQYNGKLELKSKAEEAYYINNYDNLTAKDITNISQFNVNGAIGASAGIKFIKLKAQYIYGFTNILKKLNTQDLDTAGNDKSFKGNQSMLVFGALLSF